MTASAAPYWDSLATDLDRAKWEVWSVPPAEYEATTQQCIDQLAAHLPADPASILDVGCGIGRLTIPLARRYPKARLTGHDVSGGMLALATQEGERAGVADRITWHHGEQVPAGPFDAAVSIVVLQHLERRTCGDLVAEVAASLSPGGRFVFQLVGDRTVQDKGHIPEGVARAWVEGAGMTVAHMEHGQVFGDWLWVVGQR